jgi:hypothetical protein
MDDSARCQEQAADRAVKQVELFAQRAQIEHAIDLPQKMAGWDVVFQARRAAAGSGGST